MCLVPIGRHAALPAPEVAALLDIASRPALGSRPMKAVILAGGLGSRLAEETSVRPKPMVEVGGKPLLWHIMKVLGSQGVDEFIICAGYKGYMIKEYFANYHFHAADFTVDLKSGRVEVHGCGATEPWRVTVIDTGETTNTGGRLRRVGHLLDDSDEPFLLTYGDGLADVDLGLLQRFHVEHGRRATVTAVQPPGRFGALAIDGDTVERFTEKPEGDGAWISGGFFLLHPSVVELIDGDETSWESGPLGRLATGGELRAYRHRGFFQPCDTLRDKYVLEQMWQSGDAPWRNW